jgi:hypothetical protein
MKPIKFDQANRDLLKPDSMTDEECASLPVFTDGQVCISLWRPTLLERISLLLFGRLWLYVLSGNTQPPVSILIERDIFKGNDHADHS